MKENIYSATKNLDKFTPRFPIQAYKLLSTYEFKLKIVGKSEDQEILFIKEYESDSFGNFNIRIAMNEKISQSHILEIYEIGKYKGVELLLGTYMPLNITGTKKFVICDFDKTLVDTKYSTPDEIYRSLTSPINTFPTVHESVDKIKEFIANGYHPFILSASPHFYEDAMRDWLYANDIYTAGIFLKDYRKVFSFSEGDLTPKDLKVQGLYKLNHLLDIIYMTGMPEELVLMGDNFESDPLIYLTFYELLMDPKEPRAIWNKLKDAEAFKLGTRQDSLLLNKIFQLNDMTRKAMTRPEIKIFIRKKVEEDQLKLPDGFTYTKDIIELYATPSTQK